MSLTLLLHLVFAGAWLGCILVEVLFEHGSGGGSDMRLFISKLHWRVDLFIEIPAFSRRPADRRLPYRGSLDDASAMDESRFWDDRDPVQYRLRLACAREAGACA